MNKNDTNTLTLISIQHELSMAISNELILKPMIEHFINIAIRRLSLTCVQIYFSNDFLPIEQNNTQKPNLLNKYLTVPESEKNAKTQNLLNILNDPQCMNPNFYMECQEDSFHIYIFSLPLIGLIVLKRHQEPMSSTFTQMLKPVFKRLSYSCQASVKHESLIRTIENERKLEAKNRELNEALFQSQKNESIAAMVNGVSHDFNNILAGIKGFNNLIKKNMGSTDQKKMQDSIKHVDECCDKGIDLIKSMIDFAKGKELEKETIVTNKELKEACQLVKMSFKHMVDIELQLPTTSYCILASRTHFYQILLNLCKNASDAMKPDGTIKISVSLQTTSKSVCHACTEDIPSNFVRIKIADQGNGIKAENMKSIFTPFYTTKGKNSGSGIGLSVVNRIIHLNEGHITCESIIDQGTTFTLYFPLTSNHS